MNRSGGVRRFRPRARLFTLLWESDPYDGRYDQRARKRGLAVDPVTAADVADLVDQARALILHR